MESRPHSQPAGTLDARPFLERVAAILDRHALASPGAYARFTLDAPDGSPRDRGPNPYGAADAANLLWTLDRFPESSSERRDWVSSLRDWQDPDTGAFREATHHPIHTTAHCAAALQLFDARPRHPLAALAPLGDPAAMEAFLDALEWRGAPWTASHEGAGLYAALHLTGEVGSEWEQRYFAWLSRECDSVTGLWRRGAVPDRPDALPLLFPHLAGTFHYLFNCEHARVEHPYPGALADTCLSIWEQRVYPLARFVGFAEVDWVYCLHRAARAAGRLEEARLALAEFATEYVAFLTGLDAERHPGLDDLHALFGAVSALAELQTALPGQIVSDRPLRLVLDRRPFL